MTNENLLSVGNIVRCFQCGTCTSACTTNSVLPEYNPRRAMEMILSTGAIPTVEEAWACATCANCAERCPRGVSAMEVMLAVRSNFADKAPEDRRIMARNIVNTGHAFNPPDGLKEIRTRLGLADVALDDENVAQVQAAVEKAGLSGIVRSTSRGGDKR